ncbi:MAG: rhodanese-like domain-containing protein [Candidatus Eremiobacteraeota bacterium]|nr:rhodanese-like domain-containing protein [Candidatus Eremiobacteraeota bacterium]
MTMRTSRLIGVLLLLLSLAACAPADVDSPESAKQLIDSGALVVDVRSEEEFQSGHLEGALNVPHTEIEENLAAFGADKEKPNVVYCRSGRRSGIAKEVLEKNGFTSVHNGGGYEDLK